MKYTKVTIKVSPENPVASELMIAQMGEMGYDSFVEQETGFEAYIPSGDFNEDLLKTMECPIEGITFTYDIENIADQNWNKEWEENYFQPIVIGEKCVIRSSNHQVEHAPEYDIVINPQMSFGTGHHATTSLMVQYILEQDLANKTILDMGCGTAILGILCSMRGAKQVTGIDIDEWAYNNAIENLALNNISNMEIKLGGAGLLVDETYDVIFANINRNILLNDMAAYANVLKSEGLIFFSGFYQEDVEVLDKAAQKNGLKILSQKTENNWVAVAYIKAG